MQTPISLTKGSSAVDATSYASAAISPSPDRTILAALLTADSGNALNDSITCSGNGLTWTQTLIPTGGQRRIYVFRASSLTTTPTPGAVTFSNLVSAGSADGAAWIIVEIPATSIVTNDGVIQPEGAVASTTSLSIVLDNAIGQGNGTVGFFGGFDVDSVAAVNPIPGSGYVELDQRQQDIGTQNIGLNFIYRFDGNVTVDATYNADVDFARGWAAEIQSEIDWPAHRRAAIGASRAAQRAASW